MKDWFKNTLIIAPVLALMSGAAYYLWQDVESVETPTAASLVSRNPIGKLVQQEKNVKRKSSDSLYWNSVSQTDVLFDQDSIRTGANSSAVIELSDKSQLELGENSLIVLEKGGDKYAVNFKTGDIETKGGAQTLAIKVKDAVVESNQADLKLSTDSDNNTQIVVTKGTATFTDSSKQKTDLSKQKVVKIDQTGKAKAVAVPLILNTPKNKTIIMESENQAEVLFTWTLLDENLKNVTLQVSNTPSFEKPMTANGLLSAKLMLSKSGFFWRVGWPNESGQLSYSEVRELKIVDDKRLIPQLPLPNSVVDFEPSQNKVNFSWESNIEASSYGIEISKDSGFQVLSAQKNTVQKSIEIEGLQESKYFWRIRAYNDKQGEVSRSSIMSFTYRKVLPTLPQLLYPTNGFKWTLNDPLLFEWKKNENTFQYRWSVYRDLQMKNTVATHNTPDSKYLWKWSQKGIYYWSVAGLSEKGEILTQSVLQKLEIAPTEIGPAIILVSPPNQTTVNRDRKPIMDPILFQWRLDRPLNGSVTLNISEKPDFSDPIKVENIEGQKASVSLDKNANYYWRVEWVNPSDSMDREISSPFVIKYRVNNNLPGPVLIEPLQNSKRVVGKPTSVEFRWNPVPGATQYRFTLEREVSSTKERVPVITTLTEKLVLNSKPLDPGQYYWFVTTLDKEKVEGSPSQIRSLLIELSKELAAPKLKPPVIK